MHITDLHSIDVKALNSVHAVRPVLAGHRRAKDVLGLHHNILLHAGPPFPRPSKITVPIMNSACAALVFEGVARDYDEARRLIKHSEVELEPAQNYDVVVPLAGVVSGSMWLHEITDSAGTERCAYAPLNGGNGPAMRLGQYNDDVVAHLHWLNGEFMDAIGSVHTKNIDLIDIARRALSEGDDCHGRTVAGTKHLLKQWQPEIERFPTAYRFLSESPMFFLNLWMAACKCMLNAGDRMGSSLITAAGANGFEFGLQIAGIPRGWFTFEASAPQGNLGDYSEDRALGAIGDSAIVDMAGFGAMALSLAPEQLKNLEPYVPDDALKLPRLLMPMIHPGFGDLDLRVGVCARIVAYAGKTPLVALGIIDRQGLAGRIGGGIYRYPAQVFENLIRWFRGDF